MINATASYLLGASVLAFCLILPSYAGQASSKMLTKIDFLSPAIAGGSLASSYASSSFKVISYNPPANQKSAQESLSTGSELVLVANAANPISSLTQKQAIDIYMGRFKTFPDDAPVDPIDFAEGSELKQLFYKLLVDKSERKIKAYWSRLLFSGRATPPIQLNTKAEVLNEVSSNPSALAYIQLKDLTPEMKIVYRFK